MANKITIHRYCADDLWELPDGTLYIIDEADDMFKNLHLAYNKENEITGFAKLLNP